MILPVSYKIYHDHPIPPNSHFIDSVDYGTGLVTLDAESSFLSSTMTIDVKVVVIEIVVIVERRAEVRPCRDVEKNIVFRLFGVPIEHRPYCLLCGSYKKRERNNRKRCDNRQKVQDVFAFRGNAYFPAPCRGTRKNKTAKETTITFL